MADQLSLSMLLFFDLFANLLLHNACGTLLYLVSMIILFRALSSQVIGHMRLFVATAI